MIWSSGVYGKGVCEGRTCLRRRVERVGDEDGRMSYFVLLNVILFSCYFVILNRCT